VAVGFSGESNAYPFFDNYGSGVILTYKYRLKDKSAAKRLRSQAVACNQVWNYANAYQKDLETRYKAGAPKRKWPSYIDLKAMTKGASKDLGIHAQTIGSICEQFARSRDKNRGSLRFRISNGARRSLGWVPFQTQSRQIDGNSIIYLKKRIRWFGNKKRPLPETAKGGAFVEDNLGRWWVAFHVEVKENRATGNGKVGVDLGLKTLATLSDGTKVPAVQHYLLHERKLVVAQRAGNRRRTKAIHHAIANSRKDYHHKMTANIVSQNSFIVVGNVNPTALAKTRMAKSVLNAGWSGFRNMLRYKCQQAGAVFCEVDERCTSLTCSECGNAGGPKGIAGLGIRTWGCENCGVSHDRDTNAAKNILKFGLSAQALVEESRISTYCGREADRHGEKR
jgi:putative transposase